MTLSYLFDEHVPPLLRDVLVRRERAIRAWIVGDPDAPPRGTRDPAILEWCERNDCLLVTNNRKSMPDHLANHVASGRHVPGILVLDPDLPLRAAVEDLTVIAVASLPGEYADAIVFLPLSL